MRRNFREHLLDVASGKVKSKDPLTSFAPAEMDRRLATRMTRVVEPRPHRGSDAPALAGKLSPAVYGLWG